MLKPPNETLRPGEPEDERTIEMLFGRLVDDGTNYARAEFELGRAKLLADIDGRIQRAKVPSILIGSAVLLAQAALVVLAVAGFFALLPLIGPIGAGLLVALIALSLAGLLVWLAIGKLRGAK